MRPQRSHSPLPVALTIGAPPLTVPSIVPNFGWYYGSPPTVPLSGSVPLNQLITFDATDHLGLGLGSTSVPVGVSVSAYLWDLGNGLVATGPYASTTYAYNQSPPSLKIALTVIDNRGRETSCARYIGFNFSPPAVGRSLHIDSGTAR